MDRRIGIAETLGLSQLGINIGAKPTINRQDGGSPAVLRLFSVGRVLRLQRGHVGGGVQQIGVG